MARKITPMAKALVRLISMLSDEGGAFVGDNGVDSMASGMGTALVDISGWSTGGFIPLTTAGADIRGAAAGVGLVVAGFDADGGGRLVGGVPMMMSGGTTGRGGGAGATLGGSG